MSAIAAEADRALAPAISITRVVPVVRRAVLYGFNPSLTTKQTKDAYGVFSAKWPRFSEEYRAKVAEMTDIPKRRLEFDEKEKELRYRIDGKTPMIDLPRLRTDRKARLQFNQRSCVALCIDDYSSKVWTRVGPPKGTGCKVDEVGAVAAAYRRQAQAFGEWFAVEFFDLMQDILPMDAQTKRGILEVTTVALQVDGEVDDEAFEKWLLQDDRPNLDNAELRHLLSEAGSLDFDLRQLPRREPESYWVSIPNTIQLPNGDLSSRRFLYLVRPTEKDHVVIGIGFDDSSTGEMASDVGLKLARFIANRV